MVGSGKSSLALLARISRWFRAEEAKGNPPMPHDIEEKFGLSVQAAERVYDRLVARSGRP